jgi:hypothetical protein
VNKESARIVLEKAMPLDLDSHIFERGVWG